MASSRPAKVFSFPYLSWTPLQSSNEVIAAANTHMIPVPLDTSATPQLQLDGLWGGYEWTRLPQVFDVSAPYLAYIPVVFLNSAERHAVLGRAVSKELWISHPEDRQKHVAESSVLAIFRQEWEWASEMTRRIFPIVQATAGMEHIALPHNACSRALDCYEMLKNGVRAWRKFVVVFRHLQRTLLELVAFEEWWSDCQVPESIRMESLTVRERRGKTRGVYAPDLVVYLGLAKLGVSAYIILKADEWILDSARIVQMAPRDVRCKLAPWPEATLKHNGPHWWYPPLVKDARNFESAARGCAPRDDQFNPTDEYKGVLNKRERTSIAQSRHPKLDIKHNEWQRWYNTSDPPSWMRRPVEIYRNAMYMVDPTTIADVGTSRLFKVPPFHLFWGVSPDNQTTFFRHALLLRHALDKFSARGTPGLDTRDWKRVLGHAYWKLQWPVLGDKFDPAVDPQYDDERFWVYGGSTIFGPDNQAVLADPDLAISTLDCGCAVDNEAANDPDIRYALLYHLVHQTIKADLELIHTKYVNLSSADHSAVTSSVKIFLAWTDDCSKALYELDWDRHRKWVGAMLGFLQYWPGFDLEKWQRVIYMRIVRLENLDEKTFLSVERQLLTFYIQSFIKNLGYLPPPLLPAPPTQGICCLRHRSGSK